MSRSDYSDDLDQQDLAMWRGRVMSAIRGKRGQKLLRDILTALNTMPEKRLIANDLVKDGEVCLLGAGAKPRGVADIDQIDPEDHELLAARFDVAACLIQEIEWINDEAGLWKETPEQRFERAHKWLVEMIAERSV